MKQNNDEHRYDDIMELTYTKSDTRPHLSQSARAAQFAPFAALVGYDDAISESGRQTTEQIILSDDQRAELDRKLLLLREHLSAHPVVQITYFVRDGKKSGGAYKTVIGRIEKIDVYHKRLLLSDKVSIPINDIRDIGGDSMDRLADVSIYE